MHNGISSSRFELTECLYTVRQLDITEVIKFRFILDGTQSNMQFYYIDRICFTIMFELLMLKCPVHLLGNPITEKYGGKGGLG